MRWRAGAVLTGGVRVSISFSCLRPRPKRASVIPDPTGHNEAYQEGPWCCRKSVPSSATSTTSPWSPAVTSSRFNAVVEIPCQAMSSLDSMFDNLSAEWNALVLGERVRRVAEWGRLFEVVEAEHHGLVRSGRWLDGREDLLGVIGMSRRETYHSAILAWLLTPTKRHGLGARFLQRLLSRLAVESDPAWLHCVRVECEVTRLETRADIVVWGTDFTIVIENKVDAGEQPAQCERLHDRFCDEVSPAFVFLTPTRAKPRSAGRANVAERFVLLSYRDLIADLDAILCDTAAQAVHDYRRTLAREFQ